MLLRLVSLPLAFTVIVNCNNSGIPVTNGKATTDQAPVPSIITGHSDTMTFHTALIPEKSGLVKDVLITSEQEFDAVTANANEPCHQKIAPTKAIALSVVCPRIAAEIGKPLTVAVSHGYGTSKVKAAAVTLDEIKPFALADAPDSSVQRQMCLASFFGHCLWSVTNTAAIRNVSGLADLEIEIMSTVFSPLRGPYRVSLGSTTSYEIPSIQFYEFARVRRAFLPGTETEIPTVHGFKPIGPALWFGGTWHVDIGADVVWNPLQPVDETIRAVQVIASIVKMVLGFIF